MTLNTPTSADNEYPCSRLASSPLTLNTPVSAVRTMSAPCTRSASYPDTENVPTSAVRVYPVRTNKSAPISVVDPERISPSGSGDSI